MLKKYKKKRELKRLTKLLMSSIKDIIKDGDFDNLLKTIMLASKLKRLKEAPCEIYKKESRNAFKKGGEVAVNTNRDTSQIINIGDVEDVTKAISRMTRSSTTEERERTRGTGE